MYIPREQVEYFRQICTNARGIFDEKKFRWMVKDCQTEQRLKVRVSREDFSPIKYERKSLQEQRKDAVAWMMKNYSRDERILIIIAEDSKKYLSCFSADKFKTEDSRQQIIAEFRSMFRFLREKMAEFRWSKKFLAENGIDFVKLRNLFYQVAAD